MHAGECNACAGRARARPGPVMRRRRRGYEGGGVTGGARPGLRGRLAPAAQCARRGPGCRRGVCACAHRPITPFMHYGRGSPPRHCILNDRLLTWRSAWPPDPSPNRHARRGRAGRSGLCPRSPRWLLAIPDAITPARGARPGPPHPPRSRTALRRLEGARHAADDGVRRRPDRAPADPAARRAPAPAPPAPDSGPPSAARRRAAGGSSPRSARPGSPGSGPRCPARRRGAPGRPARRRVGRARPDRGALPRRARTPSGGSSRSPRR